MQDEDDAVVVPLREGGARATHVRKDGWTRARRTLFLDMLAATANVRAAIAAAGMSSTGLYALRRRDADFAALWSAALDQGYARLEAALLARALGEDGETGVNAIEPDGDRVTAGPIDRDLALRLLQLNRAPGGPRKATPPRYRIVPIEEVEKALSKQLDAFDKRRRAAQ